MTASPTLKFAGPLIDEETIAGVADVLRSGHITSGPWVETFERALSQFCGGRPVRTLASATAAVEVALQLAEIGAGDEVITCAQSFFTVLNMIVKVGATPVFVDCDLVTRNIDLGQVDARIGPRTRAIMPTHWPGSLVDMDALHGLARRRGLRVIEDAALVIGSQWKARNIGALGDLVTFSFHPNKNVTLSVSRPILHACCRRRRMRVTASRGTCSRCCCRLTRSRSTAKAFAMRWRRKAS